jgi:hypothetical protein
MKEDGPYSQDDTTAQPVIAMSPASTNAHTFTNTALRNPARDIRLATLLPGAPIHPIKLRIHHTHFDNSTVVPPEGRLSLRQLRQTLPLTGCELHETPRARGPLSVQPPDRGGRPTGWRARRRTIVTRISIRRRYAPLEDEGVVCTSSSVCGQRRTQLQTRTC